MPPARPRSTKLMKIMISNGRLKNSKIHKTPGLIRPTNCSFLLCRKKFNMLTSFRENTGRSMAKRDRSFITNLYDLMLTRHNILRPYAYLLTAGESYTIVCIRPDIDYILHLTLEVIPIL